MTEPGQPEEQDLRLKAETIRDLEPSDPISAPTLGIVPAVGVAQS